MSLRAWRTKGKRKSIVCKLARSCKALVMLKGFLNVFLEEVGSPMIDKLLHVEAHGAVLAANKCMRWWHSA